MRGPRSGGWMLPREMQKGAASGAEERWLCGAMA